MGDSNSGITFVLDTSNQHPKVKPEGQLEEFLVYYELHVDDQTFHINALVWAKDSKDAFSKMPEKGGEHYQLQRKGVIGAVKDEERRRIHDVLHDIGGGIILP